MALSLAQRRALALVPKITGWISFGFSGLVAATVLRDKNRRSLCYHRLICGISLVDMSASLWLGMSTWPIPRESGALWAVGNDTTCRVQVRNINLVVVCCVLSLAFCCWTSDGTLFIVPQGFFTQFGISSSFYNASLAIYFYLVIVRGWNEKRLRRIEWMLHTIPLLWALTSAVTGLILDVFDNATLWCWVSGDEVAFRWIAFYGPLWLNILIVTFSCLAIFLHVRKLELASQKHRLIFQENSWQQQVAGEETREDGNRPESILTQKSLRNPDDRECASSTNPNAPTQRQSFTGSVNNKKQFKRSHSIYRQSRRVKDVADQCFFYAAAFYINWAALTATRLIQTVNGRVYYPLVLIAAITVPMQGLPNFVVYLRPKLRRARRRDPNAGWFNWVARSMARNESRHESNVSAAEAARMQRISVIDGMNPSRINDHDYDDSVFDEVGAEEAVPDNHEGDDTEKGAEQGTFDNHPVTQD